MSSPRAGTAAGSFGQFLFAPFGVATDDVLDFRFNDGVAIVGQPLCNQFIGGAAFSNVAGQYRYALVGNQTQIQVDNDGVRRMPLAT